MSQHGPFMMNGPCCYPQVATAFRRSAITSHRQRSPAMRNRYLELATTPAVRAARLQDDGIDRYDDAHGPVVNDRLGPAESAFIAGRDSFYLASSSEDGWPYVQHRGGPAGFLRVIDERTPGFADFRGNEQYLTVGNTSVNPRVSLFLIDYAQRRRLKIFGTLSVTGDPEFALTLRTPGYKATVERSIRIDVAAVDWNCPQHITPRFTEAEIAQASAPLHQRIAELEQAVVRLQSRS
jgi:predicted pyridoxine 5'-phosphate oxidase superfamily flavin-nucleotide-binding protein